MKNDVWEKAERIFHTALDLPAKNRNLFLRQECANDDILFSEVESLLDSFEENSDFLDEPIFEKGLELINIQGEKDISGSVIGCYELQEKIGAGGMGEVYKAVDTRLNRRVALKFLSESLKNDRAAKRRFLKEAQAVAMLEHPNICSVHGIEQSDEHHFIVMQYIEGKTLGENTDLQPVNVEKFKSLARQIIGAVAFAHSHGVIHRDLKPGNIMLTVAGQIKVLDFGLAKIVPPKILGNDSTERSSQFSQNGLVIGTVSYMSPEQLRGEKLDYRSDIFSLGIVLYELLGGQNPFSRKSQAETIAAILSETPVDLRKKIPNLDENVAKLIENCLKKNRQERFQSADEMLVELNKSENVRAAVSRRYEKVFLRGFLAVLILLISWSGVAFYVEKPRQKTLAVLPISVTDPKTKKELYLADDLTQSITDKLSDLSDLQVKNKYSAAHYAGKNLEPQTVGKELNADTVFSGEIRERADGLFLETRIIKTSDGTEIDRNELKIDETRLLEIQNDIAKRIIDKIRSRLTDEDKSKLVKSETESNEAKKLYLEGRLFLLQPKNADDLQRSIDAFTKAKDLDRNYAKAWAGLAAAYLSQSTPGAKRAVKPEQSIEWARLAAKKAIELNDKLSDSYNSLGLISLRYDWNWTDAESNFRKALDRDPDFLLARIGLIKVLKIQERYDEAQKETDKIKDSDPLSVQADLQTALIYYRKGDYAQADRILSDLIQRDPDNRNVKNARVYPLLITGRFNEALGILQPMYNSKNEDDKIFAAAALGFAYARTKRRDKAYKIIADLGRFEKNRYVPAQEKALVYLGLGNYDKVFERLNLSCAERFSSLPAWINEPLVDEIKNDPRFAAIRKCANL